MYKIEQKTNLMNTWEGSCTIRNWGKSSYFRQSLEASYERLIIKYILFKNLPSKKYHKQSQKTADYEKIFVIHITSKRILPLISQYLTTPQKWLMDINR